jgi:alpha-L-rhamnosidase
MKKGISILILVWAWVLTEAAVNVVQLKCEYLEEPMGIDMPDPRFFWQLASEEEGQEQTAYRLIVASTPDLLSRDLGDMFDSGTKRSSQNTHLVYDGKPLEAATLYYWKVKVWDKDGKEQEWSEYASFTTGLFTEEDWKGAEWISWRPQDEWTKEWWRKKAIEKECFEWGLPSYFGARMNLWERYNFFDDKKYDPSPLYRKEFEAPKEVIRATAFISGIGYYELFINGARIGDQVLDPGWTNYKKTILYATHDITDQLKTGKNAAGVMLGNGFYSQLAYDHWGFYREDGYIGQPKLICRIKVDYADGTTGELVTDLSWKVTGGPVVYNGPHMGEIYDATKEIPGWAETGLDDSTWDPVQPAPSPGGKLIAQLNQPIRKVKTYQPAEVVMEGGWRNGIWVDAGTQLAGWLKITLPAAKKGDKILVYFGEHKNPVDINQPAGLQQMAYVAKGVPGEVAICKFTYKGFRYATIYGYGGKLTRDDIEVIEVHSDVPQVGTFSCSNEVANAVHDICTKALRFNLHSIPTDCPHREKNGWMGDAVTGMEFGMANYDLAALMTKYTRDMFDTQNPDGGLSIIAPDNHYMRGSSTLWSSAAVHVPWYMYMYYGDTRLFEQYWDKMMLWVNYSWEHNNIPEMDGMFNEVLGDWVTPLKDKEGQKPGGNAANAAMNFHLVLKRMAHMAGVLGYKQDQNQLVSQAERVKTGINKWIYNPEKAEYIGNVPYGEYIPVLNVMALDYGIVPDADRQSVEDRLIRNIVEEKGNHLYGGIFAVQSAYEYLPTHGYADLAYQLIIEPSWPSFGWMVGEGATTLWEGFTESSSDIHHFMGSVDNYFYRHLAGINFDMKEPGFRKIIFRPNFLRDLDHAEASYQSIQGEIAASWEQTAPGHFIYKVTVPSNTQSELILPEGIQRLEPGKHTFTIAL